MGSKIGARYARPQWVPRSVRWSSSRRLSMKLSRSIVSLDRMSHLLGNRRCGSDRHTETTRRPIIKSKVVAIIAGALAVALVAAACGSSGGATDSPTDGAAVSPSGTSSGFGVATFTLDPDNPPAPDSATLHLLATERACASGQAPVDRQVLPTVVESANAVTITVLVQEPVGAQTCQGNPSFAVTVQLDAPLGDRAIRDAAVDPPEERP